MNFKFAIFYISYLFFINNCLCGSQRSDKKGYVTSLVGMEELLKAEEKLIFAVEKFTQKLEAKIKALKNLINQLKTENDKGIANPQEYLHNPLNCYSLIRRMHYDWQKIEIYMEKPVGIAYKNLMQGYRPDMPNLSDLSDASDAIYRLQYVYDLKAEDLARGILNGKQYGTNLKAIDCFNLAFHMYSHDEYEGAELWINQTLLRYNESDYERILDFSRENILSLKTKILNRNGSGDATDSYIEAIKLGQDETDLTACKGEFSQLPSRYHCNYNFTTSPFLRLAPLKMEVIQLDPYIVLYHDVMYDSEIKEILKLAIPRLERSVTVSEDTYTTRISKTAWIDRYESTSAMRISRRVEDMTGLVLKNAEELQVVNYGIGGQYELHFDDDNNTVDPRLATVLFYLSDVEQGGATVFPKIEKAIHPRKGSAVFFYNFDNQLYPHNDSLHGACPVIYGSKWICTQWITTKAQMFRKPCYKN